jgi:Uma2 family endonuclease
MVCDEPIQTCSADNFLHLKDWADYELVRGVLVPRHGGARASQITVTLVGKLMNEGRTRAIGRLFGVKAPYRCFPDQPETVRRPSASFIQHGHLPGDRVPKGYLTIPPDLAIEVVSPWQPAEDLEEKRIEYLAVGVRLVWFVYPEARTVYIHRPDGTTARLTEADTLSGESVVPGFACRVAELFA